jgi:hypothetical protein
MRKLLLPLVSILSLLVVGYLLWFNFSRFDLEAADHQVAAENERHDFVISNDFNLIKTKLIELHRDYWTAQAQRNKELLHQSIFLLVALGFTVILAVRGLQGKGSEPPQEM